MFSTLWGVFAPDDVTVAESVRVLALFHKDMAPKWRTHVLHLAAVSQNSLLTKFVFLLFG